jgi:hypothetical protein
MVVLTVAVLESPTVDDSVAQTDTPLDSKSVAVLALQMADLLVV